MNAPAHYRHVDVQPLGGGLGAEILGADVSETLTDEQFAEVRQAFGEFGVIL